MRRQIHEQTLFQVGPIYKTNDSLMNHTDPVVEWKQRYCITWDMA